MSLTAMIITHSWHNNSARKLFTESLEITWRGQKLLIEFHCASSYIIPLSILGCGMLVFSILVFFLQNLITDVDKDTHEVLHFATFTTIFFLPFPIMLFSKGSFETARHCKWGVHVGCLFHGWPGNILGHPVHHVLLLKTSNHVGFGDQCPAAFFLLRCCYWMKTNSMVL